MKFIEIHPTEFPDRRIYINTDNIMAVGEYEQKALIFYNTVRAPEQCVENYDTVKMKIIKALED